MTLTTGLFVLTIVLYAINRRVHAAYPRPYLSPAIATPAVLIAVLLLAHIPYSTYLAGTRGLVWMIGPATVAFAIPIYENRRIVARHWRALAGGTLAGCTTAIASSFALSRLLLQSPEITHSMLARSISTPFALAVSPHIGGTTDLVAIFVIVTGMVGMIAGECVLAWLPLRTRVARGAVFGASSHAFGTAKARQIGEREGVIASLVMMFSGVLMVLIAPLLGRLFA
ncbi:LrgB family protein [Pararobbsia silviterrae]|uniref:LrgB family protein n=1 Tax=Pararobbsia silviterrae TaxID=1792498 RepID=A0A494YFJ0_9BURK|nr:LrgB family protein [Pararobbsia silviterrae]RKP59123.1 LrgB family protein [Pararobbsia silviterrae]